MKQYHVYVMVSQSKTLYVGATSSLSHRVEQHRDKASNFTSRYNISRLVYYEAAPDPMSAIAREKQIKGWTRAKKIALVESFNPEWDDLAESWFASEAASNATSAAKEEPKYSLTHDSSLRSE